MLHVCCAPCAVAAISRLRSDFDITAFFYNPNIHPEEEYKLRMLSFRSYVGSANIDLIEGVYDVPAWRESIKGLEKEPEGGRRCAACYTLRMLRTAALAKESGMAYIATTLSTGPSKEAGIINAIGESAALRYGLTFVPEDFKKKGGYALSLKICRELGIYRQNYCGCSFSR